MKKGFKQHQTVSDPILHDIIVSLLKYNHKDIFEICQTIPETKNSRLFSDTSPWIFYEPRKEFPDFYRDQIYYRQKDCVWFFDRPGVSDRYQIIHEVKTGGSYTIEEVLKKYKTGIGFPIWIWGWDIYNKKILPQSPETIKRCKSGSIKRIPLEYLLPVVIPRLAQLYSQLMEG